MEEKLDAEMKDHVQTLHERMAALEVRMKQLEEELAEEKIKIPRMIEERNRILTAMLEKFQEEFRVEVARRKVREDEIVAKLQDHEHVVEKRFVVERKEREEQHMELEKTLEYNIRARAKGDEKFREFVKQEFNTVHNSVEDEAQIREQEDDEIVETLSAYTKKLQSSLHIINATNT